MKANYKQLRTYLIQAVYDWCVNAGERPYLKVMIHESDRAPDFLRGEDPVVFDIHPAAVLNLEIDDEFIRFQASFDRRSDYLEFYIGHVISIHGNVTGQGVPFPYEERPQGLGMDDDVMDFSDFKRPSKGKKRKTGGNMFSFAEIRKLKKGESGEYEFDEDVILEDDDDSAEEDDLEKSDKTDKPEKKAKTAKTPKKPKKAKSEKVDKADKAEKDEKSEEDGKIEKDGNAGGTDGGDSAGADRGGDDESGD